MNKPQTISSFIINNKDILCNEFSKETVKNWIYARRSPNKTAKGKILKIAKEQNVELEVKSSDEIKAECEIILKTKHRLHERKLKMALQTLKNKTSFEFRKSFCEDKKLARQHTKNITQMEKIKSIMKEHSLSEYSARKLLNRYCK